MTTPVYDRLGYLVKRLEQTLRNKMDKDLGVLGLTTPQYAALSVLELEPGLSNADVARRCFVTPQTMHQILLGLERAGLVERSAHPEHGRVQQTHLTARGKSLLNQAHDLVTTLETQMTSPLSETEYNRVARALEKCTEALTD